MLVHSKYGAPPKDSAVIQPSRRSSGGSCVRRKHGQVSKASTQTATKIGCSKVWRICVRRDVHHCQLSLQFRATGDVLTAWFIVTQEAA